MREEILYLLHLADTDVMPSYLGQNFLKDAKYINFIVEKIEQYCTEYAIDTIIEIGPGKGALTKRLLELERPLILCERDPQMVDYLLANVLPPQEESQVSIILGDVLEHDPVELLTDHGKLPEKTIVAGNLPYYITSPIMLQFFGGSGPQFDVGIFMVQKEVAEKVRVDASKKSFLWWMLNYHYDVKYLKTVPAKAFSPAPKVQSAVISLIRKKMTPGCHYDQMKVLLERISMYKRKTLAKSRKMADAVKTEDGLLLDLMGYKFLLPEELQGKRIEEVSWNEMDLICK